MYLRDLSEIWGISVLHLKDYAKKYRIKTFILFLIDVLVTVVSVILLYDNNSDFQGYIFMLITICLVFSFISQALLNQVKWELFKFYKRFKNCKIEKYYYDLDEKKLFSILYCIGNKRVKQDKDIDYYKELIISSCSEDIKCAKKVMKYLRKYRTDDISSFEIYSVGKGNKRYFVDFILPEQSLSNKEDIDDESVNYDGDN